MDIAEVCDRAAAYACELQAARDRIAPTTFRWYHYGSLGNFWPLDELLTGPNREIFTSRSAHSPLLDLGVADGETSFFLETLGFDVHAVDHPPTNFNGCQALYALKSELSSAVEIHETDLDSQFSLPGERYEIALVFGLLYHLKNPYYLLEQLAPRVGKLLLSTRVTQFNIAEPAGNAAAVNRRRVDLTSVPAAYLVDPSETNNDPTNYWMFTEAGLRRILSRTGWDIVEYMTIGAVGHSDPATDEGDERAFLLAQSRVMSALLGGG